MSTQAIGAPSATMAPGEAEAASRVAQIESMLEQARTGATGTVPATAASGASEASSFEAALDAATGQQASGTAIATAASAGSSAYNGLIEQAAARNGIEPALLHGLIQQESGFDPNAESSSGALGLTQLMPGTASSMGVSDPLDPAESIEGGARYLSQLMSQFGGNTTEALAAYNAGPGAVSEYGGVPPYAETENYVNSVESYAGAYRQDGTSSMGVPT